MKNKFDPYNHFGVLTHRVSRLLDQKMQPILKKKGYSFPTSCLGILASLWSKDGVKQADIGCAMVKNKSSVNKMLEALEEDGMIEKRDDPNDKRNKLIFLTPQGLDFRNVLENETLSFHSELINTHSEEEIAITKKVLKTFYLNLKSKISNELL